jgi:hypothetical protein
MRYLNYCLLLIVFAMSCMEYNIGQENKGIQGEPNPRVLVPEMKTDIITQIAKPEVDVLWVIDNSCSMAEEQTTLVNNFDAFISYFLDSGLDWHIGVTSTDIRDNGVPGNYGTLRSIGEIRYIDEDTPNPIETFRQMASLGVTGSGNETGISAAYNAIALHGDPGPNQDFYREDATLSIITISDENDYSTDPSLNEFISWLSNLKPSIDDVSYSSIVCLDQDLLNGFYCGTTTFSQPSVGSNYISVTNAVGGILWDVREYEWAPVLDELGLQAAGLKREFFLTDIPILETLDVWVVIPDEDTGTGEIHYNFDLGVDYTYSQVRNSITFITFVPPQLSRVEIEYIPLGTYNYGDTGQDTGR